MTKEPESRGSNGAHGIHQDRHDVVVVMVRRAAELLAAERAALDALNVFPVPDRDTGTNLTLTVRSAARALGAHPDAAGSGGAADVVADGLLRGARGSSGVLVAQYLGRLARSLAGGAGPRAVAQALAEAALAAREAVADPVEGTLLTVGDDAAASAGRSAANGADEVAVAAAALDAAVASVRRTPDLLPVLRAAGTEDAGGWGLVLVLAAVHEALGGVARAPSVPAALVVGPGGPQAGGEDADADQPCPHVDGEFEVMALLHTDGAEAARVRAALGGLGTSVATTGGDDLWQVHVHTDDVDPVLELLGAPGLRAEGVGVRHLHLGPSGGVVLVTAAPGLVPALARAGAVVLLAGRGPDGPRPVAAEALARALEDAGSDRPLVLAVTGTLPPPTALDGPAGPASEGVDLRCDLAEAQVVAAATALALEAPERPTDRRALAAAALRAPTAAVDPVGGRGQDQLVTAAHDLLAAGPHDGHGAVLTFLTRTGSPSAGVTAAVRSLEEEGIEVVVLASGAPGTAVELLGEVP